MKFQNPSFKFFLNGRTNERTNERMSGQMDGQAESNMLPTFSKFLPMFSTGKILQYSAQISN